MDSIAFKVGQVHEKGRLGNQGRCEAEVETEMFDDAGVSIRRRVIDVSCSVVDSWPIDGVSVDAGTECFGRESLSRVEGHVEVGIRRESIGILE